MLRGKPQRKSPQGNCVKIQKRNRARRDIWGCGIEIILSVCKIIIYKMFIQGDNGRKKLVSSHFQIIFNKTGLSSE